MRSTSLQRRIAVSLAIFSVLVAAPIIWVGAWMNERNEQEFWRIVLNAQLSGMDTFQNRHFENGSGALRTYSWRPDAAAETQPIPAELRGLSPGVHDELEMEGREWVVLIRKEQGRRVAIALDITDLEAEEHVLSIWAVVLAVLALVVFLLTLNWLARRAVAPVTQLSDQLKARPVATHSAVPFTTPFHEREIKAVVESLNSFLGRMSEHVQRERQFVETMSHELRTPLAVILGALEVLEQRATLAPREAAAVTRVRQTARDLLQLSQVLLALSTGSVVARDFNPVSMRATLHKCVDMLDALLQARRLQVQWIHADDVVVQAVPPLCELMVNNLLRNCLDHASDGVIEIDLRAQRLRISNRHQPTTTSAPSTANSAWLSKTGLGLDIISRVCAQFGWTLSVADSDEQFVACIAFDPAAVDASALSALT